jgi:hypothetical protein
MFRAQMEGGVSPLLSSIEDAIEAIFLTAHKEDFSMEAEVKQVRNSGKYFCKNFKISLLFHCVVNKSLCIWHGKLLDLVIKKGLRF